MGSNSVQLRITTATKMTHNSLLIMRLKRPQTPTLGVYYKITTTALMTTGKLHTRAHTLWHVLINADRVDFNRL